MNKKLKLFIIICSSLVLILFLTWLFLNKKENGLPYGGSAIYSSKDGERIEDVFEQIPLDLMSDEEKRELRLNHLGKYQVISRDEDGKITEFLIINEEEKKPIEKEVMTDEEKTSFGLSLDNKVQILERDDMGKIISYRIMKSDSDFVNEY